jgi:cardiolipin synthase (CMP-forming)
MLTTLPMTLTLSRIIAIPVVVALFYVEGNYVRYIACAIYTAAAVTDYFDGYFARVWQQQTKLGRIFDPIADKLLVASTILMLVAFDRIAGLDVLPALVILCREVLVSGLREFLAEINKHKLPVTRLAKWKTGIQMTALGFFIVGDAEPTAFLPVTLIGEAGLWIAAVLTLITGYDYLAEGLKHVGEDDATKTPKADERPKSVKPARPIF